MDFAERRRPPLTRALAIRALLGWLAIVAVFVATRWHKIATLDFDDVDDELRLVQVRDLLHGQSWFDLHQYRIDPPHGVLMHWSRLVDLPLLLTYRLFAPLLGADLAERVMLVAVPLLTLGVALFFLGRLAWRLFDPELGALACVVVALSPPFAAQFQPLRIDHHGWQIVAVLAAMNGLVARRARLGGWVAGAALALGMSVSLELLPIAALFGGVFALRWLEDRSESAMLVHFSMALATVSAASLVLTHGTADLAAHCDTLSPPYLAGLGAIALGIGVLAWRKPSSWPLLLAGLGATALIAFATTIGLAPQCSRGPFQALDPLVQQFWYANVYEGRPVWLQRPAAMLQMVVPPAVGLVAAIRLWREHTGWLKRFWRDYALVLAGLLVLGIAVARASAFSVAVGTVPLAWLVREWLRKLVARRSLLVRLKYGAAVLLALLPGAFALALTSAPKAGQASHRDPMRVCNLQLAARELSMLPKATLLAPLDIGPTLLAFSPHAVIATGHHRAPAAMRDVIAAFIGTPEDAQRIALAHSAGYVVLCPALPEAHNYQDAAPHGLAAELMAGRNPPWLRPLPLDPASGVKVWVVVAAR